jgi:Laminin B (Domain IV)
MLRANLLMATVALTAVCLNTPATADVIVSSTFDTDAEGWTIVGPANPLEYFSSGGNPGGHIRSQSLNPPDAWYFNAPTAFLGDKSTAYGGILSYDLRGDNNAGLGGHPEVILSNNSLTLFFDAGHSRTWESYSIPLVEYGAIDGCSHCTWRVQGTGLAPTMTEMKSVLSDLKSLKIRGGISALPFGVGRLDNVAISAPAPEPVTIDIKPGTDPNCMNINSHGVIPVAVLGSAEFDVQTIDQTTLSFAGLEVRQKKKGDLQCHLKDTNIDGYWDLVCQFEDDETKWMPDSETEATLTGNLLDGIAFRGTDSICLRRGKDEQELAESTETKQGNNGKSTTEEDNLNPLPWWAW